MWSTRTFQTCPGGHVSHPIKLFNWSCDNEQWLCILFHSPGKGLDWQLKCPNGREEKTKANSRYWSPETVTLGVKDFSIIPLHPIHFLLLMTRWTISRCESRNLSLPPKVLPWTGHGIPTLWGSFNILTESYSFCASWHSCLLLRTEDSWRSWGFIFYMYPS